MEMLHKRTYSEHYDLEAVAGNEIEKDSCISGVYEATDLMGNGLKLKVEIYHSDDTEEEDAWVCAAYKAS
ncbi:TPA: hypothetical protein ACXPT9_004891 [Bacillus cereus]